MLGKHATNADTPQSCELLLTEFLEFSSSPLRVNFFLTTNTSSPLILQSERLDCVSVYVLTACIARS